MGRPPKISDFYSRLRDAKLERQAAAGQSDSRFYFLLEKNASGSYVVKTVDSALKPMQVSADSYRGFLRRALEQYNEACFSEGSLWDDDEQKDALDLTEYPDFMYALLNCSNVVLKGGKKVEFHHETCHPMLMIIEDPEDATRLKSEMMVDMDDSSIEKFDVLTDAFILSGHCVYGIPSLGNNFDKLEVFLQPFYKKDVVSFIELFLTYVQNVGVVYEDKKLKFSDEKVESVATILVEEIQRDMTLVLRVVGTTSTNENTAIETSEANYKVKISQRSITARPVKHVDYEAASEKVVDFIRKYAKGKSAKNDIVYYDGVIFVPQETASVFLLEGLPTLLNQYRVLGLDKLMGYKVRPMTPSLNVKFGSGIDFLDANATVELGKEKMNLQTFLDEYRKNRYVSLQDGSKAVIDADFVKKLERIFSIDKKGNAKISFFDIPEVEKLIDPEDLNDANIARPRKFYEGLVKLADQKARLPEVNAELRGYQVEGYKWLRYLYDNDLGGCLADDMGLGKTVQVITLLCSVYPREKKPTLIVMPRSLLFNWQCELQKFAPGLDFSFYYGQSRDLAEAMKHQVILTTYAIVRNDIEQLSNEKFHMAILDESQTIKNVQSQQAKSAFLLKAKKRFALSGTPLENNLTELYSLFRFLNPGMFGTLDSFNSRYATPIQKNDDTDAAASLRMKIFPFILRRMKKDVLKDLPERVDQTIYVDMEPEMKAFYDQRRIYYLNRIQESIAAEGVHKSQFVMFQALTELRRIASVPESLTEGRIASPKLEAVAESVVSAVENGHKVVVFFNFIAGLELLGQKLQALGIDYAEMTGATRNRSQEVNRFQNDPDCKVFLLTLKTGGVGLNLTAADMVFIVEPWWNKAAEEQAVNRLHRIGQTSSVFCFSYITHDTIEEKIQQLQQQKAQLFDSIIASDESMTKNLSEEDINFILS